MCLRTELELLWNCSKIVLTNNKNRKFKLTIVELVREREEKCQNYSFEIVIRKQVTHSHFSPNNSIIESIFGPNFFFNVFSGRMGVCI